MGGLTDRQKLILMPCLAPNDQLKLSSDQLNLSAWAGYGKNETKFKDEKSTNITKYKCNKIQMEENTNRKKMQNFQNKNMTKYESTK